LRGTAARPPAPFNMWMRAEIDRWGRVIREQRITLE
jgi:hypothetical protein